MKPVRFVILGGGTAGWMTALLFNRAFPDCCVTLVDSSHIGSIGVGEGSTPALKSFMDAVGIAEAEWMPSCGATYKSGVRFENWSTRTGFQTYFHPFLTHFDRDHIKALAHNIHLRKSGVNVHAHPDIFCYSNTLALQRLSPVAPHSFPFEVQYGYHFDAGRLGELMKSVALTRGVRWIDARVQDIKLNGDGEVASLQTDEGGTVEGDFFVDCSGFAGLIAEKQLGTQYLDYSDVLFNDTAVTLLMPPDEDPETQTRSIALSAGWAWRIPLQSRTGYGYVFSSRYQSGEDAETELRYTLGANAATVEARQIRFRVGRLKSVWNRNVLAVGLSQGFLEPLEATALALVQLTIARFVKYYEAGGRTNIHSERLNSEIAAAFDNVKDYLHTHFLTSNRDDSEYWRACRANTHAMSENLRQVFAAWMENGTLAHVLERTGLGQHYKINSWLYILAGMGIFPPRDKLREPDSAVLDMVPLHHIQDFMERCALNHETQKQALEKMANVNARRCAEGNPDAQKDALLKLLGSGFGVLAER